MIPDGVRLIFATGNAHKLGELRAILTREIPGFDESSVVGLNECGLSSPVEDGVTFADNALIKARAVVQQTGVAAIADDSGIVVDVLGSAPGVFSARWAGSHGDDQANLDLLLDQLADVPRQHRAARFVCAAALVRADGTATTELGEVVGSLLYAPTGDGGFGYDPIFQPDGYGVSMAELSAEEKNAISHRGKAFSQLAGAIGEILAS